MPEDEYGDWYDDEDPDPAAADWYDRDRKDLADRRREIEVAYQALLGRGLDSEAVMEAHLRNPNGIAGVRATIANSDEYKTNGRVLNEEGTGTDDPPPANTTASGNTVSPISTSTEPSPVPRTPANPFGSNAPAASDVGMSNMIERDKPSWEAYLKENWPKSLLDKDGNPDDPGAIDGVIRQLSYARNGLGGPSGDAITYLNQAIATAKTRSQSGGDVSVTGNYNTNWNDLDPSRLGGKDPSAAYTTAMGSLQTQLDAERDPTKRNALQTKMAAMFNGAYVGPPPPVSTLSAITDQTSTPTPTPPTTLIHQR